MDVFDGASLLPHRDGSCGVTWLDRDGEVATVRTRQFSSRSEAEAFARNAGLEPSGPEMALESVESFRDQAWDLAKTGHLAEAEEYIRAVLRVTPDDPDMHRVLGAVLTKLGRIEEAIPELEAAVQLLPSDGAAHHNLGVAYGLIGRRDTALASLEAAAEAGMATAAGSDLIELLRTIGEGPDSDDPHTTQNAVRHYLRERSGAGSH